MAQATQPTPAERTAPTADADTADAPNPVRPNNLPEGFVGEADVPEGFPLPGPTGQAVLKQYPAHRLAQTPGGGRAFMQLFFHIQREDIPMTSPVVMAATENEAGEPDGWQMAFLYPDTQTGQTGQDPQNAGVQVVDAEPMSVVSFGYFGRGNPPEAATEAIAQWLQEHPQWEAQGPMRRLGYNSPMVPVQDRYWEVQQPVRPAGEASDDAADAADPVDAD